MKILLAAIAGIVAVGLAVTAAVLLGANYSSTILNPPDDSAVAYAAPATTPTPAPTVTQVEAMDAPLPLPTEADIPASFDAQQRADALDWLKWQAVISDCMADAGYPEYSYSIYWQPGFDPSSMPRNFPASWPQSKLDAAQFALNGSTGGGADYHWEDAGCAGAATHQFGFTN